jgi:hypothetical protein
MEYNVPFHLELRLRLRDFRENSYLALSRHEIQTLYVSVVAIGKLLRAHCLENEVSFRLYIDFHWRDFPETSYLALSTHALQTLGVLLR